MHAQTAIIKLPQNVEYVLYIKNEGLFKRLRTKISFFEVNTTIISSVIVTIDL